MKTQPMYEGRYEADVLLKTIRKYGIIFAYITLTVIALVVRYQPRNFIAGDYIYCLQPWIHLMREMGVAGSLGNQITNYPHFYNYFLIFVSKLPVYDLYAIKVFSVLFDFALAATCAYFVNSQLKSKNAALFAYFAVIFSPLVIMNSAMWGQCDSIYTFFLIVALIFVVKEKPLFAALAAGMAFAFKLQAAFVIPFFVLMYIARKFKLWHFLLLPVPYLVSSIPAVIAGLPFSAAMSIYVGQSQMHSDKVFFNAPTFYTLFSALNFKNNTPMALSLTFGLLACVAVMLLLAKRKLDTKAIIMLLFLSLLMTVYFLPRMHERYFYAAEVVGILYLIYDRERFYIPVTLWVTTLLTYYKYFFDDFGPIRWTELQLSSSALLICLAVLVYETFKHIYTLPKHGETQGGHLTA